MSGELRETHYQKLRERAESDQSQLASFSGNSPTTIAVVSAPRETRIDELCDEWTPALGMPRRHLKRFWAYRSGYQTNSAVDNPTERAYEDAELDRHYREHIRRSDEAQTAIADIVARLRDGEDITLVCFEEPGEPCHRHILMEMIEARLSSDFRMGEKQLIA